jgi:hypothetical protein
MVTMREGAGIERTASWERRQAGEIAKKSMKSFRSKEVLQDTTVSETTRLYPYCINILL